MANGIASPSLSPTPTVALTRSTPMLKTRLPSITGDYRLTFEVAAYFKSLEVKAFYPFVQITFTVSETSHHHVPLLLSPFGYSTYRGS